MFYPLLLGAAILVSAASAGVIYAQSPERRPSQLFALALMSAAYWAACELCWNISTDAEAARHWMKLACAGGMLAGALVPHLIYHSLKESSPVAFEPLRRRQAAIIVAGYVSMFASQILVWTTDLAVGPALKTAWGWTYESGPVLDANYLISTLCVAISCHAVARASRGATVAEALQLPFVWLAIAAPVVLVFSTEFLSPLIGSPVPRLGSASLAFAGALVVFTVRRYGLTMITMPRFGEEILEALEDGVALTTGDGSIRRANGALAALSGYGVSELIGLPLARLVDRDFSAPSDIRDLRRELIRKDGSLVPVSISIAVLRERQMNELGHVVVVRDLRELEGLRLSSETNARLAAVGELAAGLAHEINNPIAFVISNLRMLEEHWEALALPDDTDRDAIEAEGRELIAESLEGVERAAEIVRGVKDFSHIGSADQRPCQVNDLLAESVRMMRPRVTESVRVECRFNPLPETRCCPQRLEQVFRNLLGNALHAVRGNGLVRVESEVVETRIVITISDDGHGIDPEVLDRIFDPFFTTKPVGEGTGLGLGIAHNIVREHGGSIAVESQPGVGATFRVTLPVR